MINLLKDPFFVRNLVYGLEDSFISTTGLLVGITFAGLPLNHIIISGLVLVLVEASSMAFGTILSEESFLLTSKKDYTTKQIIFYGLTMFISYIIAGLLVLLPYIFNVPDHYKYSLSITIVCLFLIIFFFQKNWKKALFMTICGTLILIISIIAGQEIEKRNKKNDNNKYND